MMLDPDQDQRCSDRDDYPGHIVFVHVGTMRPRACLSDAADQAFEEDPDALIWLFTERIFEERIRRRMKHGNEKRVRFVFTDEIPVLATHEEFRQKRRFPPGGGDFWRLTSERFYYLYDLLSYLSLKVVVHVESDVMIYAPLSSLINSKRQGAKVLFPLDRSRGIASVIFFEDANACESLCRHGIDVPAPHDMDLLENYFQAYVGKGCASLPTIPEALCQANGWDERRYSRPSHEGWGLFDAAALGQYLGGIDPIHDRRDTRGFINEESAYKPTQFEICWAYEHGKRHPIALAFEDTPIRNLHIHSKQTYNFRSNCGIPIDPDEIITGERVMTLCDIVVTTHAKMAYHKIQTKGMPAFINLNDFHLPGTTKIKQELFDRLDDQRVIFVYGDMFRFFTNHIAPYLEEEHVIVVHNSDENIDESYDVIFSNPAIKKVFAQNLISMHPNMQGIPIGLANPMFPHGNLSVFVDACRSMKKRPALFCEGIGNTHPSRRALFEAAAKAGISAALATRRSYPAYLNGLVNSSHALCPRGNGIDTHRLWEAIYSGTTAILREQDFHRAIATETVYGFDNWDENLLEHFNKDISASCNKVNLDYTLTILQENIAKL